MILLVLLNTAINAFPLTNGTAASAPTIVTFASAALPAGNLMTPAIYATDVTSGTASCNGTVTSALMILLLLTFPTANIGATCATPATTSIPVSAILAACAIAVASHNTATSSTTGNSSTAPASDVNGANAATTAAAFRRTNSHAYIPTLPGAAVVHIVVPLLLLSLVLLLVLLLLLLLPLLMHVPLLPLLAIILLIMSLLV